MRAKDLMKPRVMSVRETDSVEDLLDVLVANHFHGAPVLDQKDVLVGVVTQQDLFFASSTQQRAAKGPDAKKKKPLCIKDIMTAPAVSADVDLDALELCRMMVELRIHRIPITREGRLAGIVSSLDICAAVLNGDDFQE